jgi:hypothetical protein
MNVLRLQAARKLFEKKRGQLNRKWADLGKGLPAEQKKQLMQQLNPQQHAASAFSPKVELELDPLPRPPLALGSQGWAVFIANALPNFVAQNHDTDMSLLRSGCEVGKSGVFTQSCWDVLAKEEDTAALALAAKEGNTSPVRTTSGSPPAWLTRATAACSTWLPICMGKDKKPEWKGKGGHRPYGEYDED